MTTETKSADIQLIQRILPHRYPFLLVDKVVDISGYQSARGIKNVTMNEPHFQGHFPGTPIMPGVTIVEAMAQTAGVMLRFSTVLCMLPWISLFFFFSFILLRVLVVSVDDLFNEFMPYNIFRIKE